MFQIALTIAEQAVIIGIIRRQALATGLMTGDTFDVFVSRNTNPDGSIDWNTLFQELIAALPTILAFIEALAPLFSVLLATLYRLSKLAAPAPAAPAPAA